MNLYNLDHGVGGAVPTPTLQRERDLTSTCSHNFHLTSSHNFSPILKE